MNSSQASAGVAPLSGASPVSVKTVEAVSQSWARRLAIAQWRDQGMEVVRIISVDLVPHSMGIHMNRPVWDFEVRAVLEGR